MPPRDPRRVAVCWISVLLATWTASPWLGASAVRGAEAATVPVVDSRACAALWREAKTVLDEYPATSHKPSARTTLLARFDAAVAAVATDGCVGAGETAAHRLLVHAVMAVKSTQNLVTKQLLHKVPADTVVTYETVRRAAGKWMYALVDRLVRRAAGAPAATGGVPVMLTHLGDGLTPLHMAVLTREHRVLRTLLDADLPGLAAALAAPAVGEFGMTPLHLAVTNADAAAAQALLRVGAPVAATDVFGRTPREIAGTLGYHALASLLDLWTTVSPARQCPSLEPTRARVCPSWPTPTALLTPPAAAARHHDVAVDGAGGADTWCPFPRVDVHSLDADTFMRDYVSIRRPVIIKGALDAWEVRSTWTPQSLATRFADRLVQAGSIPYATAFGEDGGHIELGGYQSYLAALPSGLALPSPSDGIGQSGPAGAAAVLRPAAPATAGLPLPPYIFDNNVLRSDAAFFNPATNLLPAALAPLSAGMDRAPTIQFFYGPALSGAPHHFHGDAVNALVRGRKRWLLLAPARAIYTKAHPVSDPYWSDFMGARGAPTGDGIAGSGAAVTDLEMDHRGPQDGAAAPYVCTQVAGDLVYVPAFWGHATLNEAESIGCAVEFDRWKW